MRTIELQVFKFDELSQDAQERAIEWMRSGFEFVTDYVIEDFLHICDLLGIVVATRGSRATSGLMNVEPAIYYTGFWCQGDGACFEGTYAYRASALEDIKKYAPVDQTLHNIAYELDVVQKRHDGALKAEIHHLKGMYYHERSVTIDVWDSRDEDATVDPDSEERLTDALRSLMKWLYRSLERDYEYQTSDESLAVVIKAGDFEFYEDGTVHN